MAALEAEYAQLQADDAAAEAARQQQGQDLSKAKAVHNQAQLWDRMLAVRIALQRGFATADRLPSGGAHAAAQHHADGVTAALGAAQRGCSDALAQLLQVLNVLVQRNEHSAAAPEAGAEVAEAVGADNGNEHAADTAGCGSAAADTSDQLWAEVCGAEQRFAPFRDAAIDKWHRKTMLATGHTALRGQMQALNQSLSQQVAAMLRDPTRAVARAQRDAPGMAPVLCVSRDEQPSAAEQHAAPDGASQTVPGTYDDTGFYQVLLHEYLEAAGLQGPTAATMQVRDLSSLKPWLPCPLACQA